MKTKLLVPVVAALAAFTVASPAELKVGDPAPKIQVGKWVQGEAVKEIEKGKVYVVEFWATWCGPCKATIPHLNELHTKLKDKIIFIGQNVWEEDATGVEPFVKKMGDKMTYRVALDDTKAEEKGFMAKNWMEAAGQDGIPCAFIVDKESKIVWIGHPSGLKEEMLVSVEEGKFDAKKAAEDAEKAAKAEEALGTKFEDLQNAVEKKDWKTVDSLVDEIVKIKPEVEAPLRLGLALEKGDGTAAAKQAKALAEGEAKGDATALNELAWTLVTKIKKPEKDVLEAAESIIKKSIEAGKDAENLDTCARIQFLQGKKDEAVKTMEEAVSKAEEAELKEALQKNLDSMKKGELPPAEEGEGME